MKLFGKILSFVGSLGLLIGFAEVSALGVSDVTPAVRIEHHNLAFGNRVCLLYAVETEGTGGAAPFMEFRIENSDLSEPDAVCRSYEYRPMNEGDQQSYYVFALTGLNAAQMADVVYARAGVNVGGQTYYSETDSYSVCEYAAKKLGIVDGVMPTEDAALQELLLSMLEYGSDAQTYLGYRTDTLANEFYLTFGNSETPTDGVAYEPKADGTAEVTGYEGSEARVVIARKDPQTGRSVTSIRAGAFRNNGTVTEVIVPETVKTIGDGAFEDCDSLTYVDLREGVQTIGEKAFSGCRKLKEVRLPVSLTSLGKTPFPSSDDLTLCYAGTKAQLKTLLGNSAGWANDEIYCFVLADKTELRYPGDFN